MRVVFLGFGAEQLPVQLLSAILKRAGHDVRLVFNPSLFDDFYQFRIPALAGLFNKQQAIIDQAVAMKPDVIAMSVLTNTYRWGIDAATQIKDRTGCKVIFGGVHPSAVPETVIAESCVDAVCVGEGDHAFPMYLRALETEKLDDAIPNLWHKRADGSVVQGPQSGFEQDLDTLPFLDKELYEDEIRIQDMYMTMTGRGCPYRCTFCFNNFWARLPARSGIKGGKYVRQRSVDNVIEELKYAKRRWNVKFVDIEDDIFTVDKPWIQEFTEKYRKEIKVPYKALTHPKYVDEDIIRWLKESGCVTVNMGIQSVDEHYKNRKMKRYEKVGDVAWAIDELTKAGIYVKGDHIFGSPGEGIEAQEAARTFYAEHTPSRISTFWMTYYPGIDMTAEAVQRGDLTQDDVERLAKGETGLFHLGAGTKTELKDGLNAYRSLFGLMPAVPKRLRKHLKADMLAPIPESLRNALTLGVDVAGLIATRHPEFETYARHYAHQIGLHLKYKLGRRPIIELESAPRSVVTPVEQPKLVVLGVKPEAKAANA